MSISGYFISLRMHTARFLLFGMLLLCWTSCSTTSPEEAAAAADSLGGPVPTDSESDTNTEAMAEDTVADFDFQQIHISISRFIASSDPAPKHDMHDDTLFISAEVGESIEGQFLSLTSDVFSDFRVEQRFETSVTVMREGPHCDLTSWKHAYSEWNVLKRNDSGAFVCATYTESERKKFPAVTAEELKQAVREGCSEDYIGLLSDNASPTEYPCGVGISRYFIRITGTHRETGERITKVLAIEAAMGC